MVIDDNVGKDSDGIKTEEIKVEPAPYRKPGEPVSEERYLDGREVYGPTREELGAPPVYEPDGKIYRGNSVPVLNVPPSRMTKEQLKGVGLRKTASGLDETVENDETNADYTPDEVEALLKREREGIVSYSDIRKRGREAARQRRKRARRGGLSSDTGHVGGKKKRK